MPLRLMTVDDSTTIRRIVGSCATALTPDVEVLQAENGQACLDLVRRQRPDIIILDINMPVMNGEECLKRLKEDPATASIPVVLLTTETEKVLVLRLLKLGVAQFIVKPFTRDEFREKVSAVLERHGLSVVRAEAPVLPAGDYVIVVEDKPAVLEQIRAGCPEDIGMISTADPGEALRAFGVRAPLLVIANLALAEDAVFDMFSRMRRTPDRQGVRYVGTCLRTAEDAQARAQAYGYIELLPKPFTAGSVEHVLLRLRRAHVQTAVSGDIRVIQAARGGFEAQASELYGAIDHVAEEGLLNVLIDLTAIEEQDQELPATWRAVADRVAALGMRAVYVTRLEAVHTRVAACATLRDLTLATDVADGVRRLAA